MPYPRLRRARGRLLLATFLTGTLALSGWLGYQAVDAAASHRRTAEGVLVDYAGIAASAFSQSVAEHIDDFLDDLFDDVPRRSRAGRLPDATVVAREMDDATRGTRCACPALEARSVYFRIGVRWDDHSIWPDTVADEVVALLVDRVRSRHAAHPADRREVFTLRDGGALGPDATVAYLATRDDDGNTVALYGFAADRDAFAELVEEWHGHDRLLPRAVADEMPDDSLVAVRVATAGGTTLFASVPDYPADFVALDTIDAELGGFVVEARVRPDAAGHLVIGGLPRSRIPLLVVLLLLTLGLGVAALVQMRREHQLARLRDDFVSGVSHEFRTPLTQIRMFAELLHDGKLRTEESRQRASSVINREALRLTQLIENVLSFSAVHHSGAQIRTDDIVLRDVAADVVEGFAPLASARGVRIDTDIDSSLQMQGSRAALHQILTNLLDNALKYGPDGQTVRIDATCENGSVRIAVSDEGPGVPGPERRKIWDPYERLERDVVGDVQGSGIGLAVVAELAGRHGGQAWIEDADGAGSRFLVEMRVDAAGDAHGVGSGNGAG